MTATFVDHGCDIWSFTRPRYVFIIRCRVASRSCYGSYTILLTFGGLECSVHTSSGMCCVWLALRVDIMRQVSKIGGEPSERLIAPTRCCGLGPSRLCSANGSRRCARWNSQRSSTKDHLLPSVHSRLTIHFPIPSRRRSPALLSGKRCAPFCLVVQSVDCYFKIAGMPA